MTQILHSGSRISDLECGDEVTVGDAHYRIDKIAGGGMGLILLLSLINEPQQRSVHGLKIALKTVLPKFLTADSKILFERELTVWAGLRHPNIVALNEILDAGVDGRIAAMDGCLGSLRNCFSFNSTLSLKLATDIIDEITDGLAYAYKQDGILHLDLKPENVLYNWDIGKMINRKERPDIEKCRFMISDWGIASIKQVRLNSVVDLPKDHHMRTQTFNNVGTCLYMAPERFLPGFRSSLASDVFSVGMIYLEILMGYLPYTFQVDPIDELLSGAYFSNAQVILKQRSVPELVREFILNCIARFPEERPTSYSALREKLAHAYHSTHESKILVKHTVATDEDLALDNPLVRSELLHLRREYAEKQSHNLREVNRIGDARAVLRSHLEEIIQEYEREPENPHYLTRFVSTSLKFNEAEYAKGKLELIIAIGEEHPFADMTLIYFNFGRILHALHVAPQEELSWYQKAIDAIAPSGCKYIASQRMKAKASLFAVGPANRSMQFDLRDMYVKNCRMLAPDINFDNDRERLKFVEDTQS